MKAIIANNLVVTSLFFFLSLLELFSHDAAALTTFGKSSRTPNWGAIEVDIVGGLSLAEAADTYEGTHDYFWLQLPTFRAEVHNRLPSCVATSPTGEVFSLAPNTNSTFRVSYPNNRTDNTSSLETSDCIVVIRGLQEEDTGRWNLTAAYGGSRNSYIGHKVYNVHTATKEVPANGHTSPETVQAPLNQEVTINMVSNPPRILNMCLAVSPNGTKYHLAGAIPAGYITSNRAVVYGGRGLDLGDCGAKIGPMEREFQGRWRFRSREADSSHYTTAYTEITVTE